jgi:hypothetical protein
MKISTEFEIEYELAALNLNELPEPWVEKEEQEYQQHQQEELYE